MTSPCGCIRISINESADTCSQIEEYLPDYGGEGTLAVGAAEGTLDRVLLQVFSTSVIGPIYFEAIQRKGDDGFGEGNFRALFVSIEDDQLRRGGL